MASSDVPIHKKRRWNLFKAFLEDPETKKAIEEYQAEPKNNLVRIDYIANFIEKKIPSGCERAYMRLLDKPAPSTKELIDLIEPPVKIISHLRKAVLPANTSLSYFDIREMEDRRIDGTTSFYYERDEALYLRLDPWTNKTELRDFIKEHFDSLMEPLLRGNPEAFVRSHDNPKIINSKKRVSTQDSNNIKIRHYISKRMDGNATTLAKEIKELFGLNKTAEEIRSIKSKIRKSTD